MINYKNNDIKEVHYKGFDITQMYACGSNLVWEKEIPDGDYLTFVASSSGVFSCATKVKYSKNGSWWHTLAANGSISVNSGDVIKWKGSVIPAPNGACRFGSSTAQFAVSGNPMSMILGDNFEGVTSLDGYDYAFEYMFTNCSGLTSIDGLSLPFTTISARCYRAMFAHCTSLASIPSILSAATVMKEKCYMNMFLGCTNLTSVPNDLLPSTTLAESCYYGMFAQSGIIDAEGLELPATTLALSAYTMMFQRATSLEKAPILSAATLVDDCYHSMFYGCSSLSAITCLATSISASNCVFDWVNGVAPSGEFRRESAMTDWQVDSINGIPIGWSIIPPLAFKLKATYTDGKSYNLDCNASNTLSTSETQPSGYDYTKMKDAEIGSCTTSIGISAFTQCTSLSSVTISDSVTSIGNFAFYRCSGLTSVDIPSGATEIGNYVFSQCYAITSVTIPSSVTSIGLQAFAGCRSLSSITIPNSVTTLGDWAFASCSGATSLTIGNGVTSIGSYVFSRCSSLSSVVIPNSVTSIGEAAFYGCISLTSVTIPDSVTEIGVSAFASCRSLSSITIPSGVTSIGNAALQLSSGLTSITIEATTPPTLGTNAFQYTNDCPIYVPCQSVNAYKTATNWSTYASRITCVQTPKFILTLQNSSTVSAACDSTSAITFVEILGYTATCVSAVIENCVTTIGQSAFRNCSSLTSVEIPDSVTSIGNYAFNECSSLLSVDIPNTVTSIGKQAFNKCSSLTSVTIPSGVTSIGNSAFASCSALTSITVEATTPPTLGSSVFDNTNNCPIYVPCESVEAYKAADGWRTYASRIQCKPKFDGKYKFTLRGGSIVSAECDSTSAITTAETDAYKTSMVSAVIGDCVKSIGTEGFSTCLQLTSVTISDSVTSIGNYAFANCYGVSSFTIPSGVTSIGEWAFNMCGYDSITIKATTPPTLGDDVFDSSEDDFKIYVPSASVNAYKTADGWSTYAARIQAIS